MILRHALIRRASVPVLTAACLACIPSGLTAGASSAQVQQTGFYFDTVITISLYDTDDESILQQCFDKMQYFEDTLSRTKEGSDIWNINHANGEPVEVSDETIDIITRGISYCDLTGGALDLTIEPVSSLWDFHAEENSVVPDADAIEDGLAHIDYTGIVIDGNTVSLKDPESGLDLGAIAKGYISDAVRDILLENGCESALINLGGNVMTVGSKPDGQLFQIGIRRPFGTSAYDLIEKIGVSGSAVITSGTYERYFEQDGRLYHHILDPNTGYPVENNLTSVSIFTADGTLGDALSTACFVLGEEKGMELIESLEDTEALFITEDGSLLPSSGWTGETIE